MAKKHPERLGKWRYANDTKGDQMVITFKESGAVYGMMQEANNEDNCYLTKRLKLTLDDVYPLGPWRPAKSLPEFAW